MSVPSVSSATPQFQAAIAAKTQQQQPEGATPPAEKALDGASTQINAVLGAMSSGLDISV